MGRGRAGKRWQLDHAIEQSGMPPIHRHLLHTLLRSADAKTAVIPDEWQPSSASLIARTGLRRADVAKILTDVEKRGCCIASEAAARTT